ncbi:hypothetical protein DYGSA30_32600 [Dyella sp. GSA-30]|nr:hypothetical protein DYGSA30_32600 [Dyella sp. GSA-30]
MSLEHLATEPIALPVRKVRVLDRQLRQRQRPALHKGSIQGDHLPRYDAHRPAVRNDVMHRQQQRVINLCQPDEAGTDQGTSDEIEGFDGFLLHAKLQLRLSLRRRRAAEVDNLQR